MPGVAAGDRALLKMLNAGGTRMILFFAVGSVAFAGDVLSTRLGKLFLGFVSSGERATPRRLIHGRLANTSTRSPAN